MAHDDQHPPSNKARRRLSAARKDPTYKIRQLRQARETACASRGEGISPTLVVQEITGDMFEDMPQDCLLIHACNCVGSWGAGIAADFKKRYPKAFQTYHDHCKKACANDLIGTALLIPPDEEDAEAMDHWIGCLFTSRKFGKDKDVPQQILEHTESALLDLMSQVSEIQEEAVIQEIRMCRINAGLFKVPWEETKMIVEATTVESEDVPRVVKVYEKDSTTQSG